MAAVTHGRRRAGIAAPPHGRVRGGGQGAAAAVVDRGGNAWGGSSTLPFLYDLETHAPCWCALPLLILAERIVHQRMRPVVRQFVARGLIPDAARATFDAAIATGAALAQFGHGGSVVDTVRLRAGTPRKADI